MEGSAIPPIRPPRGPALSTVDRRVGRRRRCGLRRDWPHS